MGPARARRRRAKPVKAGDILVKTLAKLGLGDQGRRLRLYQVWHQAVGPEIAARTEPGAFSRGVLTVKATSNAWLNELTFLREEIICRLNKAVGSQMVKDLKLQSGRLAPKQKTTPEPVIVAPLDPEDLVEARRTAEPIEDPEVRAAFESMMGVAKRAMRRKGSR